MRVASWLITTLFLALALSGCLTSPPREGPTALGLASVTAGLPFPDASVFDVNGTDGKPLPWSLVVEKGPYAVLPGQVVKVTSFDGTKLALGIFLPEVPNGTRVPVMMDVGPYYGELDDNVGTPAHARLGKFLIDNFVPHGYAVVQASVRGTGQSEGCNDYLGAIETKDIDATLTYLGKAPWSSGKVAVIGKSYDGTTAWEAATTKNPYLKTIVPIEGIDSLQQLHYRNGSSEVRSLTLGETYWQFGAPGAPGDAAQATRLACAPTDADGHVTGPAHPAEGAYGYATGGGEVLPGPASDYWKARDYRAGALANANISLFLVHGFQDWNVKPSQGLDIYNKFNGTKKALIGEWAHDHADRAAEHPDVRMDWAEMLLRWFEQELKGVKTDTGPAMTLEDTHGYWRTETANAFPPLDAKWSTLLPTTGGKLVASGASGSETLVGGSAGKELAPLPATPAGKVLLTFTTEAFSAMTRISGQPQLHVTVTPRGPGGSLWAELHELTADGKDVWIGRAQMNLDYASGGTTFAPVTPNTPLLAKMEFYPLDARILAGSKLKLVITQEAGGSDVLPRPETAPMDVQYGEKATVLRLPIIQRAEAPTRWDMPGLDISKKTGGGAETGFAQTFG
ncbi:MAG: CocE/NonD family hydrolase [Candidatus Thermoplasmatota archaeon]